METLYERGPRASAIVSADQCDCLYASPLHTPLISTSDWPDRFVAVFGLSALVTTNCFSELYFPVLRDIIIIISSVISRKSVEEACKLVCECIHLYTGAR